jgi:hypothetical protein
LVEVPGLALGVLAQAISVMKDRSADGRIAAARAGDAGKASR